MTDDRKKADEDRTDEGREEDYHGDAGTESPTAPESSGIPHGEGGTVDPGEGGPDQRPVVPDDGVSGEEEGATEETPVRSPVDRSEAKTGSGSASSAAASKAAGSEGPADAVDDGSDEEDEEEV